MARSFITSSSNVWRDGIESWTPISDLSELKTVVIEETRDAAVASGVASSSPEEQETQDKFSEANVKTEEIQSNETEKETALVSPEDAERISKREKKRKYLQRKKKRIEEGQWLDSSKNLSVYIAGLPDDTTEEEVASVFRRAGVIKIDPMTTLPKIKLYTDDSGKFKNDARVTFVNKESVEFAIRYFDNYHFRENCIIHVEEARYDPQKHIKKPIAPHAAAEMRKRYLAAKYEQERLQGWTEEVDDGTGRRIVLCKPMFSSKDAEEHEADSDFYKELREEVIAEITKFVPVEKVTPIARHPQGVVCVKLKNSADAEIFISKFRGRIFDSRKLEVYFFDGKTDLQAQTIPSKYAPKEIVAANKEAEDEADADIACDWIDNQSSDEEFEIKTE